MDFKQKYEMMAFSEIYNLPTETESGTYSLRR